MGFVAHHAAFDGYSESVIAEDLGQLYRSHIGMQTPPLVKPVPLQTAFETLNTTRTLPDFKRQRSKAAFYLSELPDLLLDEAGDTNRPRSADARALRADIPNGLQLRQRAMEFGISYFTLLATAYARTIRTCTGSSDVVFGVPVNRRMGLPLAQTVGNFVSMLPMRIKLPEGRPFDEVIPVGHSGVLSGLECMDLEFDDILGLLPPTSKGRALYSAVP
ncbi:condensation domain-containing protein [Streptomyces sp. NPDC058676]|uniref:condensation domain-containing protein n=1 Tax=unclassified Streptomyces TaxID=2593676 RepID=UPI0036471AE9